MPERAALFARSPLAGPPLAQAPPARRWAGREEDPLVVYPSHAPGPIRWDDGQVIDALVHAAIVG